MSLKRTIKRRMELMNMKNGCGSGLARSYMLYRCRGCGKQWIMFLETGLEEHGDNHKPVPFMVRCRCGEMAQDISGLIKVAEPMVINKKMSYFANRADSDCGVPVLRW